MLTSTGDAQTGFRQNVILAPRGGKVPPSFRCAGIQDGLYASLLGEMQRLRGRMYLQDDLIKPEQMTVDGRHVSPFDERSWHILTLDHDGSVAGCARITVHRDSAPYSETFVSTSQLAKEERWAERLRRSVEREIHTSHRSRIAFAEVGGWAVNKSLRHTTEALKLALGSFAFGELIGGGIGIVTAVLKNQSAPMLMRLGLRPLTNDGEDFPVYYDPYYRTQLAVLRFDTYSYDAKYRSMVVDLRETLRLSPVVCSEDAQLGTPLFVNTPGYAPQPYLHVAA